MRFESKGIAFMSIILARRGSFITFAFTASRWARDLKTIQEKTTVSQRFGLTNCGKRFYFLRFKIISHALPKLERAVVPPRLARFLSHAAIGVQILLWNRDYKAVNIMRHEIFSGYVDL